MSASLLEEVDCRRALPADARAIVIGASAGGVQVLSTLLPALPQHCRCSVLIVVHLPRGRRSLLAEVFAPRCRVAVREAQDKEPIAPGTVYFAPADYHLLVEHGNRIALSADEPVHHSRPSIDVLFESAAEVYRERLVGIILSGANADGAVGLAAVGAAGGFTVAQRPESALAPAMIRAALEVRAPDCVLSIERIAQLLGALPAGTACMTERGER